MKLTVVMPGRTDGVENTRLGRTASRVMGSLPMTGGLGEKDENFAVEWIRGVEDFHTRFSGGGLKNARILFLFDIGATGICMELYSLLQEIRQNPSGFAGSIAGLVVDGESEWYTKAVAREFVFSANGSGCLFVGRPLVEATKGLANFSLAARVGNLSPGRAYQEAIRELVFRVARFSLQPKRNPKLLCLHSCNARTSNTYMLWSMVKEHLKGRCEIREIFFKNGEIKDCLGCSYDTCLKYGQNTRCYYGGVIVDAVYPALESCDGLMLLCPNYNDALGANLTAFINRMTALYRKRQFYDKYLFSIIVSGYSGGDIVAAQVIDAVCMNKTFILPPYFAMTAVANEPGSVKRAGDVEQRAQQYALGIAGALCGSGS